MSVTYPDPFFLLVLSVLSVSSLSRLLEITVSIEPKDLSQIETEKKDGLELY